MDAVQIRNAGAELERSLVSVGRLDSGELVVAVGALHVQVVAETGAKVVAEPERDGNGIVAEGRRHCADLGGTCFPTIRKRLVGGEVVCQGSRGAVVQLG